MEKVSPSEKVCIDEERKEPEEKFRNLAEQSPNMIFINQKGRVVYANKKCEEVMGYKREEFYSPDFDFFTLTAPEYIDLLKSSFSRHIKRKEVAPLEYALITKEGKRIEAILTTKLIAFKGETAILGIVTDITERKKAEEALRREREILEMITQNIGAGLTIISKDYRILWANKVVKDIFADAEGKICYSTFHQRTSVCPGCGVKEIFEKGKNQVVHQRVVKDLVGQNIWLENITTPVRDENGSIRAVLELSVNITERKKAENLFRESEQRFRCLVEDAASGVALVDLKGLFTYVNKALADSLGYSVQELTGRPFKDFLHPDDRGKVVRLFLKSIVLRMKPRRLEFRVIRKDGNILHCTSTPTKYTIDGKTVGFQAIITDITERKDLEQKLRHYSEHLKELVQKRTEELLESEKRYSVLVEEASDGVVIVQDEKIVFINRKGAEISYHSKDELIGLPFEQLLDEKYRQFIKEGYALAIQGETVPLTVELEVIAKNGEIVPVEVSIARIYYQGRPALLVIIRDISERKRMEEQRLKLEKLASMGELATMVAHDLRNPLTSIRNASYYIKNSCPARAEPECNTAIEMFDIIEQETLFASNIINELLDFAAKRPLQKNKQNINKIIESSLTASKIPENIKVKRNFAEKAIAIVDGKQLERVFLNLTNNAAQAMPNGGKLTIATNETKDHIEIEFTDTGAGISKENMSKLFEPLFTTKAKGIGMGLAICKKIVEEHSGTIKVKSKAGQGTTFTIKLPKKEEANTQ